ncbi:hypothetical protein A4G99_08590 [Haladaptatus sp. R4]|uniref:hypothetical protein n=1 Tax=Haladaptatus sp. R4 TaxID=1679489 RepID=UPI0007B467E9|nr:hypothetical protein [Haladaptatus sp. R4]KZN24438.1 hypothetical protein A4G99_08590 [Haladaptatus sp. R4]
MQRFLQAVRKRLPLQRFLSIVPVLAVLLYLNGTDNESILFTLVGVALASVLVAVIDSYEIDRRIFKVLFSLIVLGTGVVSVQDGSWPAVAFLVGGGWLVLDTVYDYRHGIERREKTESRSVSTTMHEMQEFSRIAQPIRAELREYAKTRDELHAALEEDNEEIDDALDRLSRMGIVTKRGRTYSIDESWSGVSGLLRKVASGITRPFTISA